MSTRSVIHIVEEGPEGGITNTRMYRHTDGYPSSNLRDIASAAEIVTSSSGTSWEDAFERGSGGAARVDDDFYGRRGGRSEGGFSWEGLSSQSDLEWVYFVDAKAKVVNVYGKSGIYSGATWEHVSRGVSDPKKEADEVMPEYKAETLEHIISAIEKLGDLGWTVNTMVLGIENACTRRRLAEESFDSLWDKVPEDKMLHMAWNGSWKGTVMDSGARDWVLLCPEGKGADWLAVERVLIGGQNISSIAPGKTIELKMDNGKGEVKFLRKQNIEQSAGLSR